MEKVRVCLCVRGARVYGLGRRCGSSRNGEKGRDQYAWRRQR